MVEQIAVRGLTVRKDCQLREIHSKPLRPWLLSVRVCLTALRANISGFIKNVAEPGNRKILFQKNPSGVQIMESFPFDGLLSY